MVRSWGDICTSLGFYSYLIIGTQSNQVFSRFKAMLGHWDVLVNLLINFYSNFDAGKKREGFH